ATTLVSRSAAGDASGNASSSEPVISADGRFVAFTSSATDLVAGFTDNNAAGGDVFLRDTVAGTTTLVSRGAASATAGGNGASSGATLSRDGRLVAFQSLATDLVAGFTDNNGSALTDVFLRDTVAGTTALVSHKVAAAADGGDGNSTGAVLSADGA